MKIIDILNKISKNELPDKTRFKVYSSRGDEPFICEYDTGYPGTIWYICDSGSRFNYKIDFMRILNYEVEVIEENKEIEELNKISYDEFKHTDTKHRFDLTNIEYDKINELVRAVNKINKQLEELETSSEISEEEINDAIKRAREYIEREEK